MPRLLGLLDRLFRNRPARSPALAEPRAEDAPDHRWAAAGGRLEVALFVGEIVQAPAEALCTSTNPRLSLGGGTGRAVMAETGWGLKRKLEALAEEEIRRTGGSELPVGFTCATSDGRPPHRLIVHCVASDSAHHSSSEAARLCTAGALREADEAGCASLALPVFGTGHADLPFDQALQAMAEALQHARPATVRTVLVVLHVPDRVALTREIFDRVLGAAA